MTDAMVRVAFKDGYALMEIADRVRVKLEPSKAGELAMALLDASDLPANACGMSNFDVQSAIGEIDVLRSDEYEKLPGCLDGVDS